MSFVKSFKAAALGAVLALVCSGYIAPVHAQDGARTLDELLELVKRGMVRENRLAKEREAKFIADKEAQVEAIRKAQELRDQEEARADQLQREFEANKEVLLAKRKALKEAKGELEELFGHINSAAGDLRDTVELSLVSVQKPNREEYLTSLIDKLKGVKLPEIAEIETLWSMFFEEIVESGKVVRFDTEYSTASGEKVTGEVVRVGSFNIVTGDGNYLRYAQEAGKGASLGELPRQPAGKFVTWAQELASASEGSYRFGVDPTGPTGGSLLYAFIDTPSLVDRWHQGRLVGYVISAVGLVGMLIATWRFIVLFIVGMRVNSQLKQEKASTNNPLGRVLAVHEESPDMDNETLELKLNEAVLKGNSKH